MTIRIAVRETFLAEVEHSRPVTIPPELGNNAKGDLFSAEAELCSGREDRTGDEFLKVLGTSMGLDNVIQQESLFFCLDAPRRSFG